MDPWTPSLRVISACMGPISPDNNFIKFPYGAFKINAGFLVED